MTESRRWLQVDWTELDRLTAQRGWHHDGDRARGLRISYQNFNHVRTGRQGPGARFIVSVLDEFGGKVFHRVFKRVGSESVDSSEAMA